MSEQEKSTTEIIQLIFYDLTYNENFDALIQTTNFNELGKNYNTVAIIGCQSSGKSTLLNNLFETNFEVMSDDKGRGQTTKGIWTSLCTKNRILIFDCEGTDSKERGDDRHKFENCSSLFGLAMADLLLVNMWTVDIGRYTASNYGVLKTVFEMNLKLFQQECAKKILFILRDFNIHSDNKEKIQEMILKDIYNIWSEVEKPEKYKDYTPEKFFEFEFMVLPHFFYNTKEFNEQVEILRNRFSDSNPNFLFSHSSIDKNVPSKDLNMYCGKIWSTILNDKDLNIPNEKEMLARFKCNEIKNSTLNIIDPKIKAFIVDSENRVIPVNDFINNAKAILKDAHESYSSSAKYYLFHIYENVKGELSENIENKLYFCFGNQAKKLIPISQKLMRNELEESIKKDNNFNKCSTSIKKKYLNNLINKLEEIKVFDSWDITTDEYEELFNEIIEHQRKICITEKKIESIKKLRGIIEEYVFEKIEDLSIKFWEDFNIEYIDLSDSSIKSLGAFFNEYYSMNDQEYHEIEKEIRTELFKNTKKDLRKKVLDIHYFAYDTFRKNFWYHEGLPRLWNKMSVEEIGELKSKYTIENEFIFDLFTKFKIVKDPLIKDDFINEEDQLNGKSKTIFDLLKNDVDFEELLSKNEVEEFKKRYMDKINDLYEDALRRHANIIQQTMPLWVWIFILYLGYDDVYRFFSGYWYIPVIIGLSIYGALKALGLTHLPGQIFNMAKNTLKLQKLVKENN